MSEVMDPSRPDSGNSANYSIEELSSYYHDLDGVLNRIEKAANFYQVLDVDCLATTGEIIASYLRSAILLDPAAYGFELPQPETLVPRIESALEITSEAFEELVNFDSRMRYDSHLFGWDKEEAKPKDLQTQRRKAFGKSLRRVSVIPEKDDDRRRKKRFDLSIPVQVTGYNQEGGDWHEAVQSIDVSHTGASILLRRRIKIGMILYLRMPMPMVLRTHEFFDLSYGTYGIVRWVKPPRDGFRVVGVEFIGEFPPPGFMERPWATFELTKWNGAERRKELRETIADTVEVEYFDDTERLVRVETCYVENISASGMRICSQAPPEEISVMRIISQKDDLQIFATARNRYRGRDGFERLCVQFLNAKWPI